MYIFIIISSVAFAFAYGAVEYRSLNGIGNNEEFADWGSTNVPLIRNYGTNFVDKAKGIWPQNLPNARSISNFFMQQEKYVPNSHHVNDLHTYFGQFVAHDISDTATDVNDPAYIEVPVCDPTYDAVCLGNLSIPFSHCSQIYGTSVEQASTLRTFSDGMMLMSENNTLPKDENGKFKLGDRRNTQNPGLLVLQELFLREHNRLAAMLKSKLPAEQINDETLYQEARRLLIAIMQRITYKEYLPALLGKPLLPYAGYNSTVNPSIDAIFTGVAQRYGHSELNSIVLRLATQQGIHDNGPLLLRDIIDHPGKSLDASVPPLLVGMTYQAQQLVDLQYVDDVRNFLFGNKIPGDLASVDIQRGRDLGVLSYAEALRIFRPELKPVMSFADLPLDQATRERLAVMYESVHDVELLLGVLAEEHVLNSNIGTSLYTIVTEQFARIRDGDRFWYEQAGAILEEFRELVEHETLLSDLIIRNYNDEVLRFLPHHAFFTPEAAVDSGELRATLPAEDWKASVSYPEGIKLEWRYVTVDSVDYVEFQLTSDGNGWAGVGIGTSMTNADIYLSRITSQGVVEVIDCWSNTNQIPNADIVVGGKSDVSVLHHLRQLKLSIIANNVPTRRPLSSGDLRDHDIVPGEKLNIIYATHRSEKTFLYHGPLRGRGSIPMSELENDLELIGIPIAIAVLGFCLFICIVCFLLFRRAWARHLRLLRALRKRPALIMEDDEESYFSKGNRSLWWKLLKDEGVEMSSDKLRFGLGTTEVFPVAKTLRERISITNNTSKGYTFHWKIPDESCKYTLEVQPGQGTLGVGDTVEVIVTMRLHMTTSVDKVVVVEFVPSTRLQRWKSMRKLWKQQREQDRSRARAGSSSAVGQDERHDGVGFTLNDSNTGRDNALNRRTSIHTRSDSEILEKCYGIMELKLEGEISVLLDPDDIVYHPPALGNGAFGTVYQGVYRGQAVAVKCLKHQELESEQKEFLKEIDLFSRLRSPYLVAFVGASNVVGKLCICTEFMRNGSVANLIYRAKIPMILKLLFGKDCASAMDYLHRNRVLYRDLKPDNLLVVSVSSHAEVNAKLADFGTARNVENPTELRRYTAKLGTPIYMAPEMFHTDPYNAKVDVYSYGIMLWEIVLQKQPWKDQKLWDVPTKVLNGERPHIPASMPRNIASVIEDSWQADFTLRPEFGELVGRLKPVIKKELKAYTKEKRKASRIKATERVEARKGSRTHTANSNDLDKVLRSAVGKSESAAMHTTSTLSLGRSLGVISDDRKVSIDIEDQLRRMVDANHREKAQTAPLPGVLRRSSSIPAHAFSHRHGSSRKAGLMKPLARSPHTSEPILHGLPTEHVTVGAKPGKTPVQHRSNAKRTSRKKKAHDLHSSMPAPAASQEDDDDEVEHSV